MTRRASLALGLDLLIVLIFAAIGRVSHDESVLGAVLTALPFWIGLGLGWLVVRQRSGADASTLGPGITVWVATIVVGLLLRLVTGAGVALSFAVVTTLVLGVLLLGWRVIAERVRPVESAANPAMERTSA